MTSHTPPAASVRELRLPQYNALANNLYEPIRRLIARHRANIIEFSINGEGNNGWVHLAGKGSEKIKGEDMGWNTAIHTRQLLRAFAGCNEIMFDDEMPWLACRTPDGHRFNAIHGENTKSGYAYSIRVMRVVNPTYADFGLDEAGADRVRECMAAGKAIIVSGATMSGKTTFLNMINKEIAPWKRVITIEDVPELDMSHIPNQVGILIARTQGRSRMTWQDAIDNALRMAPDVFTVGELAIRSAFPTWQAMDTGHESFSTTMHANSPMDALRGFFRRIQLGGAAAGKAEDFYEMMAENVEMIVQIKRVKGPDGKDGRRQVTDIGRPKDLLSNRTRRETLDEALRDDARAAQQGDGLTGPERQLLDPIDAGRLAAERTGRTGLFADDEDFS